MGLFRSRSRLIRTSYGYDPPPGAAAWGWTCTSRECGVTEAEVPRGGWPFACPRCGAPTDPAFEEPFKHDARGVEIQHLLAEGVEDGGFTANELFVWRHADALRRGDAEEARRVRAEFRAARAAEGERGMMRLGYGSFMIVAASRDAGDLDAAADDLIFWLDSSSGEGLEHDGGKRGACRQVVSAALEFLDAPGASRHPQAPAIRKRCLDLADVAYSHLLPQQQDRIIQMRQEAARAGGG